MTKNERIDLMKLKNRQKREAQVKRNIIISIMITVCLVGFISLGFGSRAKAESNVKYDKCFKSICVAYNEDLEDIAEQNMNDNFYKSTSEYIDEVMNINHLDNADVRPGNYIVVPYFIEK